MLGAAQAYRALAYLDMAQMYEFLPNEVTDTINDAGNNVKSLTIPIVDENITEDEINALENIQFDQSTDAFYIIPLLIFCLEKYIENALK